MRDLTTTEEQRLAATAREMMAIYRKNQDLINIGAYPAGSNVAIDRAIQLHEPLREFLRQGVTEGFAAGESWRLLEKTMVVPLALKPAMPPPPPKKA